jgi:HEPN domain-containing protein
MISQHELRRIARTRLAEARALYNNGRYDGAAYLAGYAVEAGLKARICRTLRRKGYPDSRREFDNYLSFRTHDLVVLLTLTNIEDRITNRHPAAWTRIKTWNPETRYRPIGTVTQQDSLEMVEAAAELVPQI